ncbi:hypothetical protein PDESU_01008 [Pontiella desulfatans]|uniref:Uncharacterized protein n=1 Tax=Pontiella desulfatans TaxID=2750659 RepID=A0A6C2TXT5_PONDE|nr:hypothetical protein [Pontiella desulfatans]VGO12455.1 hypothetical protein PDESU_01008 [Pontiella desulfatans]
MNRLFTALAVLGIALVGSNALAEMDRDQLSLEISKANSANKDKMKAFIWKKASKVTVDGKEMVDILNEISIQENGDISMVNLDIETHVKRQRGLRGRMQQKAAENNAKYLDGAIEYSLAYMYMTKGQLLDFFSKAKITDEKGVLMAKASDVLLNGDQLTIQVDKASKLFISKSFSSSMGGDPISGEIHYDEFSSGVSHVSKSTLNLPAKNTVIMSENKDFLKRVE